MPSKETTQAGLEMLIKSGIVNKNVTITQLLETTKMLGNSRPGPNEGDENKWCFVTDKYVYYDDGKATK